MVRRSCRRLGLHLLMVGLVVSVSGPALRAATPEQVEQAIEKAKAYLYAQQKQGNWDHAMPEGNAKTQEGGYTAIATYALLAAGESPQDHRMKQAIDYLLQVDMKGIYALGLRTQVWNLIPQTPAVRVALKRDATMLYDTAMKNSPKGLYHYTTAQKGYDHSCSQYGVLGAWACAQQGYELPLEYWSTVEQAWKKNQRRDGGWMYSNGEAAEERGTTPSMTAAGVATLFITQDYLNQGRGADCRGNLADSNIDAGLKWMSTNFDKVRKGGNPYTWYGIERIGVASGYKYFGNIDWYQAGADLIARKLVKDGNAGDVPNTSFAILFLVRGRAPVMVNKLEYSLESTAKKPTPAHWNQRHRDAARLVKWVGKQNERFLNWQIVNLKVGVEELHDAPILYLAGDQALNFTDEEEAKLKQFAEQGGLILANADCASNLFSTSYRKLGTKLFPGYEFRELPADHPIYTLQQFPRSKWKTKPQVLALGNGARELMMLLPSADAAKYWQMEAVGGHEEVWELATDVFLYAIDKQNLRYKGETYIVTPDPKKKPARTVKVARLKYPGNWDPEPAGWRRLDAIMRNTDATALDVQTIELGAGKLSKDFAVAHLTGTTAVKLTEPMREELKKYLQGGGTLVIDACGGSAEFAGSMESEVANLAPAVPAAKGGKPSTRPVSGPGGMAVVGMDHPLYSAGPTKVTEILYRTFAKRTLGSLKAPRLRAVFSGERPAIVFSAEDLSTGMVGQPVDGIYGYEPKTAAALMEHVVLNAAGVGPAGEPKPTTKAATKPAAKPTTAKVKKDGDKEKPKPKPKDE